MEPPANSRPRPIPPRTGDSPHVHRPPTVPPIRWELRGGKPPRTLGGWGQAPSNARGLGASPLERSGAGNKPYQKLGFRAFDPTCLADASVRPYLPRRCERSTLLAPPMRAFDPTCPADASVRPDLPRPAGIDRPRTHPPTGTGRALPKVGYYANPPTRPEWWSTLAGLATCAPTRPSGMAGRAQRGRVAREGPPPRLVNPGSIHLPGVEGPRARPLPKGGLEGIEPSERDRWPTPDGGRGRRDQQAPSPSGEDGG